MVNWISLSVPFLYLTVVLGSLATFSSLYRKRKQAHSASLAPWFETHITRDIYLTLLHQEGDDKVPDSVLKAALLRRATEDLKRLFQIRNSKGALQVLVQKGSVGDDLWQRFLRAEKEIEEELKDVVQEANAFAPGWGQHIFQSANEIFVNTVTKQHLEDIQAQVAKDKEWWEKKKATIQSDFMKELDEEASSKVASPGKVSDDDAVLVESGGPTASQQSGTNKKKKKSKK